MHHRHGFGFGVRFVDLNEEQLEKLPVPLKMAEDVGSKAQSSHIWLKSKGEARKNVLESGRLSKVLCLEC
jgi:hypothetical protein